MGLIGHSSITLRAQVTTYTYAALEGVGFSV
jgi:hypothetical protein